MNFDVCIADNGKCSQRTNGYNITKPEMEPQNKLGMYVYSFDKKGDSIDFCRNTQLDKRVDGTRLWTTKIFCFPHPPLGDKDFPIKGTVIHPKNFKLRPEREDGSGHCNKAYAAPKRDYCETPSQHFYDLDYILTF